MFEVRANNWPVAEKLTTNESLIVVVTARVVTDVLAAELHVEVKMGLSFAGHTAAWSDGEWRQPGKALPIAKERLPYSS